MKELEQVTKPRQQTEPPLNATPSPRPPERSPCVLLTQALTLLRPPVAEPFPSAVALHFPAAIKVFDEHQA